MRRVQSCIVVPEEYPDNRADSVMAPDLCRVKSDPGSSDCSSDASLQFVCPKTCTVGVYTDRGGCPFMEDAHLVHAIERDAFFCGGMQYDDFRLLSQTGTYDRRDGVRDEDNHNEMLDAMITIGFDPEMIQSLMRLVVAVLHAGNMTFTPHVANDHHDESCVLDENDASLLL